MGITIPLEMAQKEVAGIFSIHDVTENNKHVMRCSRCEGLPDEARGKSFQLAHEAITKAKEHIAVYRPEIRPDVNTADTNLRHTLLIRMSTKHAASMSKKAQVIRKLRLQNMT